MHSSGDHKILICGLGSVGQRHLNNLHNLGYKDIILYRVRNEPLKNTALAYPTYCDLDEALAQGPSVALICNPTYLHMPTSLKCASAGCHLFVEKPLSDSSDGIDTLRQTLARTGKHAMVGYMMRFHPCLVKAKEWLDAGKIGRSIYAHTQWGEYLPDWHPDEDYRTSYAARRSMGGGPALTLSHEFDLMLWLFGKVDTTVGMCNYASSLEIDTQHAVDALLRFESGVTASVHLDYVQKPPVRATEIVGDAGKICFDYYTSRVDLFHTGGREPVESLDLHSAFDRNEMFLEELRRFFLAIDLDQEPEPGLEAGVKAMQVALDAVGDAQSGNESRNN